MWQDKLKEIIYILENSNVNEIEVNFWGRKYRVVKNVSPLLEKSSGAGEQSIDKEYNKTVAPKSNSEDKPSISKGENLLSPMPGTFYSSPTPEDPPFVSKGDIVKKGQPLCIIEAMKIMNEIEAEEDGTIIDILVDNAEPVEYNQALFLIDPSS